MESIRFTEQQQAILDHLQCGTNDAVRAVIVVGRRFGLTVALAHVQLPGAASWIFPTQSQAKLMKNVRRQFAPATDDEFLDERYVTETRDIRLHSTIVVCELRSVAGFERIVKALAVHLAPKDSRLIAVFCVASNEEADHIASFVANLLSTP